VVVDGKGAGVSSTSAPSHDRGDDWAGSFDSRGAFMSAYREDLEPEPQLDLGLEPVRGVAGALGTDERGNGATGPQGALDWDMAQDGERFQRLFDIVPDGVILIGSDGLIKAANRAEAVMFGVGSPSDLVGTEALALVAPPSRERSAALMKRRLGGEAIPALECEFVRSDGSTFSGEITATLQRGADNQVSGYICTTRDTTDRKRAAAALRESEEHYRDLFDGALEGMYQISVEGKVLSANRAMAEMLGYGSAEEFTNEIVGSAQQVWADPDERPRYLAMLREQGVARGYECQFVRKDGRRIWVSLSGKVMLGPDGEVARYEGFAADITERKRAYDLLRQSEERYKLMFDRAPLAVAVTRGTDVTYANPAYLEMYGASSLEEMQGLPPLEAIAPQWRPYVMENIRRRAAGLPVPTSYEIEHLRKDGTKFPALLQLAMAEFADGPASVGFITDITERRRAEEALRETDSQFRTFVEQAPIAITVSRDGIFLYANQQLAHMLGRASVDDLVGGPTDAFFAPHMREESAQRSRRRSQGLPVATEYESVLERADGSQFPAHFALGPVRLRDGIAHIAFVTDITDRRRAEEALRESKAMRDLTERVAKVGSWRWGADPDKAAWSNGMFALLDVDPAEAGGDLVAAFTRRVHPDDIAAVLEARDAALEAGEPMTVDYRVVRRDGSVHVVHGEATTERDDKGEVLGLIGYCQDVTDQHEAAASLEAAATEWSETFDAMGDSVALFDGGGRVVRANAAAMALTARSMADIVGHRCHEIFHGPDYQDCPLRRSFETGQAETSVLERDGRWLRMTFRPQLGTGGKVVGGVHVTTDITLLHQAEQAAREHSHFLEELLEAIPVPVFYKDANLVITGVNEAFAASLGRPKEEVVGKTVFDIRPPGLAEYFEVSDREALGHPGQPVEEEVEMPAPDGTVRNVLSHKAGFSDVAGRAAGIVGVNLDVTAIRQTERRLAVAAERLQATLKGAVGALSATTELRDPYTAGHQRRVAELACAIAAEVGCEEARIDLLRTASLLHDIGKIVVPTEILSKPGKLTKPEMQLIRQHSEAGAEIVAPIGFHADVAVIIRQHHERLDGSGYPAGLHGGEILAEATILAVADIVEAMISHRPYRPALTIGAAVGELEDGAGSRYEAGACRAAISLVQEQGFTFSR
jgi:PAS domain S-box-containing protein/putative nucleotidyltransferase with HDIG domain